MRAAPMVGPGTVTDTTRDPRWRPIRVVMRFAEPIAGLPRDPMHLDGPLSWAAYLVAQEQGLRLPPLREWVHDFALPIATWTAPCTRPDPDPRLLAADGASVWGWACSSALYGVTLQDTVWVRRKPALEQMVRWTGAARHHIGGGPRRAMNVPHQAVWVDRMAWHALADPDALRVLVGRLHHVGQLARHGWGKVLTAEVAEDPDAWPLWRQRTFPDPHGGPATIRAPYWHPSRRMPCSMASQPM